MDRTTRPLVIIAAFAGSLAIGLVLMLWALGGLRHVAAPAAIGGPFQLTDQTGQTITEKNMQGHPTLIFFGFTHCPDVCPTDLQQMGLAVDRLGAAGDAVQPIFITVDPERDTPEHLKDYVASFHARFIGLTGDAPAIHEAARVYRAYYAKVDLGDSDYTVDHSSFIYLMGRDGEYLGFFPPGTAADILVGTLRPLVAKR